MQQFAIVDDTAAYLPLEGFTSADLGCERGNAVSNMVTKLDEAPMASQYAQLFDQKLRTISNDWTSVDIRGN